MRGEPTDYWGKLQADSDGRVVAWLPLLDHMTDVAVTFERLLDCGHLEVLAAAAGLSGIDGTQRARLVAMAFIHDIGKLNAGFQAQGCPSHPSPSRAQGHVAEAASLLASKVTPKFISEFGLAEMAGWFDDPSGGGGAICRMLLCSWSHHGRPAKLTLSDVALAKTNGPNVDNAGVRWSGWHYADLSGGLARVSAAMRTQWPEAFAAASPIPLTAAFLEAFNGLLTLADWIASDDRNFVYEHGPSWNHRAHFAAETADRFVRSVGMDFDDDGDGPNFEATFGFSPNAMQAALVEMAHA